MMKTREIAAKMITQYLTFLFVKYKESPIHVYMLVSRKPMLKNTISCDSVCFLVVCLIEVRLTVSDWSMIVERLLPMKKAAAFVAHMFECKV